MKKASAYLYQDQIYFHASGRREEDWLWVSIGRPQIVNNDLSNKEIGQKLKETLDKTQIDVVNPEKETLLEDAGGVSWEEFGKNALAVGFITVQEGLKFYPEKWAPGTDGYELLQDAAFIESNLEPEKLGAALRRAFNLCK